MKQKIKLTLCIINRQMFNKGFLLLFSILALGLFGSATVQEGNRSIKLGTITYSYRSMLDQSLPDILNYIVQSGLNSVELMGEPLEQFAGIPQTNDREAMRLWRTTVSMDKFIEARRMFKKKGVSIHIVKMISGNWSDEEIDYAFRVCKALGAKGVTMEASDKLAKRVAPFTEKHGLYAIFHNHGQPGEPGFSFDRILSHGSRLMLNLDIGHYYGATGESPVPLIERLHDRIFSIHIKDKTGPKAKEPNTNREFGKGETPIVQVIQLIRQNKWPIIFDIELEYPVPEGSDAVKEVRKCAIYCRNAYLQ